MPAMLHARRLIGTHNILFITLDTLRYNVAVQLHASGKTPHLASVIAHDGWEKRHSPGSFTFSAHAAFFAGFLPTPARPGTHPRLFALRFPGSETTTAETAVFDAPDIVAGFRGRGYHTICIGGVGFFNKLTPLGSVLPGLFDESHWSPGARRDRPAVRPRTRWSLALGRVARSRRTGGCSCSSTSRPSTSRTGSTCRAHADDSVESHAAALEYVDGHLGRLFAGLTAARPVAGGDLLGPRHGLRRGRLQRPPPRPPGRVGRARTPSSSCPAEPT